MTTRRSPLAPLSGVLALCVAGLAAGALFATPAVAAGAPVWRAWVGTDGTSSPVSAGGRLFVGTADGLVGLDPATGAVIVHYRGGPVSTTPAVIRGFDPQPDPPGKVVFGSRDGILYAVSTAGELLWRVELGAVPASPLVVQGIGDPNSRVVVGAGDSLFAFDGDGKRQWEVRLEGGDISRAAAVLTEPGGPERVVVAAGDRLFALDAATGAVVWSVVPSGGVLGAPSVGDPDILVGDEAGTLFALDPRSGVVVATFAAGGAIAGSPAVGDATVSGPRVVVGDGGGDVYAFDQPEEFGPPVWRAALGGPIDGPPVLVDGVVYAGSDPVDGDPQIAALDAASGRVLFDSLLPGGTAAAPVVAAGRVVVATRSGDVLAYDGPDS